MSQLVSQTGGSAVMTTGASSSSYSTTSSSSFSATSSSTSSSSTKVVKQTTTTTKSSSSSSSSSRSSSVNVRSSGMTYSDRIAGELGIDVGKEMERLRLCMSDEMANIHRDMFRLVPGSPDAPAPAPALPALEAAGGGVGGGFVVKLDDSAVRSCIDKAHDDRVKLNFDVQEFDSETINIKTVGNKIEVHATKKSKKGDEERSEEFSRVYELPTEKDLEPSKVTSSIYQDGVLTIELPVADALGQQPQAP